MTMTAPAPATTLTASTLHLDTRHPAVRAETRNLAALHSRIGDATTGIPTGAPRTLYATPRPGLLVIRAAQPITTVHLPAGYATAITHRPWQAPDQSGQWLLQAVINPVRRHGHTSTVVPPDEQAAWLAPKLPGATIVNYHCGRRWTGHSRRRDSNTITVACATIIALVHVHDPERVTAAVVDGLGRGRAWGCGLTMWQQVAA